MYQPKHMLVTGGAGFIGANFIRYYLKHYPDVTIYNLDALTYAGNLKNLEGIDAARCRFIPCDVNDDKVADLLQQYKIDTIVHFAAESHVDNSIKAPKKFLQTNVLGTANLLDAAKHYWLVQNQLTPEQYRFHHISTDEVYGSLSANAPAFTENYCYLPNSPYSASKAASDHIVRAYQHTYGLSATISNCSNNYGPYQHPEKLIPTIVRACLEQKPIPIYGQGTNVRDWLYVEDHCEAIAFILHQGKPYETYNIGGQYECSNLEMAKQICQLMDDHIPDHMPHENLITLVADRAGHDFRYAMNIHKISTELNWRPKTNIMEGLMKTINFYTQQFQSE